MTDESIIEHLTQVRGIGRWTVEMLLIFRLGRPDVLPVSDYGVRKGFALTFGKLKPADKVTPADLPSPAAMEARAARWRPWRSVASWYLWRACDLAQNKLKPQP
jgi:DNA-3-methyladenine glycosylase II